MAEYAGTAFFAMQTPTNELTVLPPLLFPPAAYFAAIIGSRRPCIVDTAMPYDKRRKAVHRYDIVDVRGKLSLTVPVGHPSGGGAWSDVPLSEHGEWWRRHRVALESAYGRTPFFEFLIDRFDSVFCPPSRWQSWPSASDLSVAALRAVCSFLAVDAPLALPLSRVDPSAEIHDLRAHSFHDPDLPPYWQVRSASLGFVPSLSILDLLFNLGPESILYLRALHA